MPAGGGAIHLVWERRERPFRVIAHPALDRRPGAFLGILKKVCSVPRRWKAGERDTADRRGIE
jgi:hypothetical protein